MQSEPDAEATEDAPERGDAEAREWSDAAMSDRVSPSATGDGERGEPSGRYRDERDGEDEDEEAQEARRLVHDEHARLLSCARSYAHQLTGRRVDTFSGLAKDDRGWRVEVEIVEVPRIPSTTDVLASYEIVLDDDGELIEYRRARRYYRNATDDGSGR